jgi:CHAT domain-containing protein
MAYWNAQPSGPPHRRYDIGPSTDRCADLAAIDDALYRLRLDCNAAAHESHLERARRLQARAEALGSRVHITRAQLEQAYVLLALGRDDQVQAQAQAALRTLLGGRPARLSAFATGHERELYLNAIALQARALAAQRAFEAILALCVPVIGDLESERARVNSPYAQSAFLATRAELYEFVAVAAYRSGRWDLLLATTELLKARSALRSRLAPAIDAARSDAGTAVSAAAPDEAGAGTPIGGTDAGAGVRVEAGAGARAETSADAGGDAVAIRDAGAEGDAEDIEAQLRQVNDRLAAIRDAGEAGELLERRQWLLGARAIARARRRGDLPELAVDSLQRALAADEAAVSWFWVGSEHLIAMAFSRDDFGAEVIALDRERQAALAAALEAIGRLAGDPPDYAALIAQVETQFETLGAALLPAALRRVIDGRSRLLLCPHRRLHLLPLHALPWRRGATTVPLIEQFAVRSVPNLSGLLLPWKGNRSGPVLAVGVGRFDAPLGDLPQAEAEAAAVAAAHGDAGRLLLGATRADFLAQPLQEYRCLHLATHGASVLAGGAVDDPLEACIHLRDGPLTGAELTALPLRAELVVLAACHSGQRAVGGRGLQQLPGDDLFGLQAVLFEAGAGTVLGTLWPVDDETARAILVDFHRAYAGGAAPDNALQAAIRAHRTDPRRRRGLFYWAPFFLISLGRTAAVPDAGAVGR